MGEIFSWKLNSPPIDKAVRRWRKQKATRHKMVQSSKVVGRTSAVMTASTHVKVGWVWGVTLEKPRSRSWICSGYTGVEQQQCSERRYPGCTAHCTVFRTSLPGCTAHYTNVGQTHIRSALLCHRNNWATPNVAMASSLIFTTQDTWPTEDPITNQSHHTEMRYQTNVITKVLLQSVSSVLL
jgi:hypothetical protein